MSDTPMPSSAAPPFNKPTADVILRTSDNTDFRVHKLILSEASQLFDDIFTLPQPSCESDASLPTVDVSEDSQVIDKLLRIIYPVANPSFSTLEQLAGVLEAAIKYEITVAREFCVSELMHPGPRWNSIDIYAVTARLKLREETYEAAERAIATPIFLQVGLQSPILGTTSARSLLNLIAFRQERIRLILRAIYTFDFRFGHADFDCGQSRDVCQRRIKPELDESVYRKDACNLVKLWACVDVVKDSSKFREPWYYIPQFRQYTCPICLSMLTTILCDTQESLAKWVKAYLTERQHKVKLDFE